MCLAAARDLHQLLAAYDDLASEVSTMRSQLGIPARSFAKFPTAAMVSLQEMENETFGEFTEGLGSQQASPSSTSHPIANDTLSGFPAEEAPIAGHGSASSAAQTNFQPVFDDIDVDTFLAEWSDQSLGSYNHLYARWAGPPSITDFNGFGGSYLNHDRLHQQLQTSTVDAMQNDRFNS